MVWLAGKWALNEDLWTFEHVDILATFFLVYQRVIKHVKMANPPLQARPLGPRKRRSGEMVPVDAKGGKDLSM